jgi:hypothetical protein
MDYACGSSRVDIQIKHTLGWSQYQVRSDQAIRRHWQLVCCAFSFCWYHASHTSASAVQKPLEPSEQPANGAPDEGDNGEKKSTRKQEFVHRCPGRWRCGRYADGWNPGSCSDAIGAAGRHCPHLLPCNPCSIGLNEGMLSHSTALLDPALLSKSNAPSSSPISSMLITVPSCRTACALVITITYPFPCGKYGITSFGSSALSTIRSQPACPRNQRLTAATTCSLSFSCCSGNPSALAIC